MLYSVGDRVRLMDHDFIMIGYVVKAEEGDETYANQTRYLIHLNGMAGIKIPKWVLEKELERYIC